MDMTVKQVVDNIRDQTQISTQQEIELVHGTFVLTQNVQEQLWKFSLWDSSNAI